jgi:hypothetical protein
MFAIPVKLPNGTIVTIYIIGDVCVTNLITIRNVLYMTQINFNLISITREAKYLGCDFVFNLCMIQNSLPHVAFMCGGLRGVCHLCISLLSFEFSKREQPSSSYVCWASPW